MASCTGTVTTRNTPRGEHVSVVSVALGDGNQHACVVLADGRVRCSGANWAGQLGGGSSTATYQERVAPTGLLDVVRIEISPTHGVSCALQRGGHVYCWGSNERGLLGVGHDADERCAAHRPIPCRSVPVRVPELEDVVEIAMTDTSVCALRRDGRLYCWGEIANPFSLPRSARPLLVPEIRGVTSIVANGPRLVVRSTDGVVVIEPSGIRPAFLSRAEITGRQLGPLCGRMPDNTARCMGSNRLGQLAAPPDAPSNAPIDPHVGHVREIVSGMTHACALRDDGTVWCWGDARHGTLASVAPEAEPCGDPSVESAPCVRQPTRIDGLGDVAHLFAGLWLTCATTREGAVWCWGRLLDGSVSATPVRVSW